MKRSLLLTCLLATACTKAVSISVTIDGQPAATIDKKKLEATKPDFQKDDFRAWTIAGLLGSAVAEKSLAITVHAENDLTITLPRPLKDRTAEPVLLLKKDGDLAAAMMSEQGDAMPPMSSKISKLTVVTSDKKSTDEREQVTEIKPLAVKVDGKEVEPWTWDKLSKLNTPKEGETSVSRDSWSLRDAAKQLVGPKARVVAVVNDEDERMELAKEQWSDAAKIPAMRVNRQGQFKFQWGGSNPMEGGDSQLRNVRLVEIVIEP
jgi:hypothetical protein